MTVAVVSFSDLARDPRVDRQIRALAALVSINGNVLAGREPPLSPTIRPRPVLTAPTTA